MKAGAGVAAVGGGAVAYSAYHTDGGAYRRRREFCVCAAHGAEDAPSCKPSDTRIHRRRAEWDMTARCRTEDCCGADHTSCYVGCPSNLPDDAAVGATTAAPVKTVVSGDLTFKMSATDAADLASKFADPSQKAAVSASFAKSLAASLDGIDQSDIAITEIAVARLLLEGRSLSDTSLKVTYEIEYDASTDVSTIASKVTSVDVSSVATSLQSELSITGVTLETPEAPVAGTAAPAMTTAAPTASVNATRMLEDGQEYYGEFLAYSSLMKDKAVAEALEEQKRRLAVQALRGLQADDGKGQMCPDAPTGCYEDFFAGGNSWSSIDGCEKFIGDNTFCDQNAEDAASTDVEESGSGLLFGSVALYVWMVCA